MSMTWSKAESRQDDNASPQGKQSRFRNHIATLRSVANTVQADVKLAHMPWAAPPSGKAQGVRCAAIAPYNADMRTVSRPTCVS